MERKGLGVWRTTREKTQQTPKLEERILFGIKDGSEESVTGTPSGWCYARKTADASDPTLFNHVIGSPWELRPQADG